MQLSLPQARAIALAAQGFDRPRPRRATIRDVARTIRRLALVQLDYVNVVVPSHYQVLFSRLGPYDRSLLDKLVYGSGEFTEHWAHEASIVPTETWPLLRYRRDEHRARPWGFDKFLRENPDYVAKVLDEVRTRGPLRADELPHLPGAPRELEHAWFGSVRRAVLEAHFGRGALAIATREMDFARPSVWSPPSITRAASTATKGNGSSCCKPHALTALARWRTSPTTSACRCAMRALASRSWSRQERCGR